MTLPDYRQAARTAACPHCDADPGQPCRTPQGRAASFEHADRSQLTGLAFRIGIEAGLRDALDLLNWQARYGVNATVDHVAHVVSRQRDAIHASIRRDLRRIP